MICQAQPMRQAQQHLHPQDTFCHQDSGSPVYWTCAQTRPRWEKKLARWLARRGMPHFLPTHPRQTVSHRKTRICDVPLFPCYVFIMSNCDKADLRDSGCVAGLIKPHTSLQVRELHENLWNIWCGLTSGSSLEIARPLEVGQWVEVVAGPLKGVRGRFENWGKGRRLVLAVDMLRVGVSVEVPDNCTVVPL